MLYRRFPGCRKRRSAHTTSHGRCQGAQRVACHPRVWRRSAPAGYPACRGRDDASCCCVARRPGVFEQPYRPRALSQEEESTVSRGRPGASVQDLIRSPASNGAGGRTRCYTVRGLYVSTLHVSLIIRVLPRAESATGCIFRQLRIRKLAPFMSKAGISEGFAGCYAEATMARQRNGENSRVSR